MNEIKIRDTREEVNGWVPAYYWDSIKAAMDGDRSYFIFNMRLDGETGRYWRCIAAPGSRFIVVD